MDNKRRVAVDKTGFWIRMAEKLARQNYDGHLSILKFTGGWKVLFGTPNVDNGEGREQIRSLPIYPSLEAGLKTIVISELENQ